VKRVLFIKIGALGDLSYALPAAQALKKSLNCHLTWMVGKSCHAFLKGHPYIDELLVIDDKKFYSDNWFNRLSELAKIFYQLRKRFDCILITHRDRIYYRAFKFFSRDTVFQLVREPKNSSQFITVRPLTTHESLTIKKLTEAAIQHYLPQEKIEWHWDYSHIKPANVTLPEHFIVLHLGGGSNTKTEFRLKCWPHWNELILKLLEKTPSNLVFVGAPSEVSEYSPIEENIKKLFPEKLSRCFNLIGKTSIPDLTDVIRRCDFFIGVDSGPLHIADSMHKKAVGLFGPTSPVSWGLLTKNSETMHHAVPCSPCYKDDGFFPECHFQHQCMKLLDAENVFAMVNKS
jgi:heptosyltransferase-1